MIVVWALLALTAMITSHEAMHLLFAKRYRQDVTAFSIGFGPGITLARRGGTVYRVGCIPLGGYCAIDEHDLPYRARMNFWEATNLLLSGVALNLVTGGVLCAFGFRFHEHWGWWDSLAGGTASVVIGPYLLLKQLGPALWNTLTSVHDTHALGGPVGAVHASAQAGHSPGGLLFYLGILSISLGVFNLLPVPVLDGGHWLMATVEYARKRNLNPTTWLVARASTMLALGALGVWVIVRDVWNLL